MDEFGTNDGASRPGGQHGHGIPSGRDDEVAAPHLAGVCEQSPKFAIAFELEATVFKADP